MMRETAMDVLKTDERERRWKKIREVMVKRGLECLIVWGSSGFYRSLGANLKYLSNVMTEGYLVFPLRGEPILIAFLGKRSPTVWLDWRSGHPTYSDSISQRLRELHLESASIGVVGLSGYYGEWGFPYNTYTSLMSNFPKARFEDATDVVEEARRIKSAAEIKYIELGCEVGEKVIQAVVDTAKIGTMEYEVRAKMMDTLFREGCEPGSMLLYCQGKELSHAGRGGYFKPPDTSALEDGDVILTEFDARYSGYMAQYNQPFSVGEPSKEWKRIFSVVLEAFNNGLDTLRPGITAGELDHAFLSPVREAGYTNTHPCFHGLGLGLEQPMGTFPAQPNYKPNLSLKIEADMVLEFEPQAVTPDGKKGLHLGSPILVTETGCRLLSKNWKPEFKIV